MNRSAYRFMVLAFVVLAGCTKKTPGYCQSDADCPGGRCDLSRNLCGVSDGGVETGDGADGRDGSEAGRDGQPVAPAPCTAA